MVFQSASLRYGSILSLVGILAGTDFGSTLTAGFCRDLDRRTLTISLVPWIRPSVTRVLYYVNISTLVSIEIAGFGPQ